MIGKTTDTSERELVFKRVFNAPRELVWEVWTNLKHVSQWWGPNGFTTTTHEMSVKPGGVWRFIMHGPDGVDYPNRITYIEVVKPERLVWKHSGDNDDEPGQFEATVLFAEQDGKTHITMRMVFASKIERDDVVEKYGAIEGNHQTMNRLEQYLSTM